MKRAIIVSPRDNVATVLEDVVTGDTVKTTGEERLEVKAVEDIPTGHKIALADLETGDLVFKYGCAIGRTIRFIGKGSHVHTHNIVGNLTE
jgi:hypothetical protein